MSTGVNFSTVNQSIGIGSGTKKFVSGFTLVELVITLSIMGMFSVLVAPSFNDWVKNSRIDTEVETFRTMLTQARQEAIVRNVGVTLDTANVAGNWSGDIKIYTDQTKGGNSSYQHI